MKTFDLPSNSNYGDQPIPIAFPENWDVHVSKIHGYDTPALTEAQIAEKVHAAISAKPISEGAAGKKSAVIIIDDITRPTPCEPIAKAVIAELRAEGEHLVHHRARHPRCHVPHGVRAQARRGDRRKL